MLGERTTVDAVIHEASMTTGSARMAPGSLSIRRRATSPVVWGALPVNRALRGNAVLRGQRSQELLHPRGDLSAQGAHRLQRLALGVRQGPILPLQAGDQRAGLAASSTWRMWLTASRQPAMSIRLSGTSSEP